MIRPIDEEEHYDLDIVCEFAQSKSKYTQKELHDMLGRELKLYAKAHNMEQPSPWQRCWTLNYADSAQVHMDLLPAVPDGARQRQLRESLSLSSKYVETSVSIPDREHPNYRYYSDDWPASNPNGYANWFYERMKPTFDRLMEAMQLTAKADVAEIPAFRVNTPLQSAIQILKRHRDTRFADEPDRKPSSIILTTLAAHSYQQQSTIAGALLQILVAMDQFIEQRNGSYWIPNPSDPRENFADQWASDPDLKDAFYDWLETARADFSAAAAHSNATDLLETLSPRLGRALIESTLAKQARTPTALTKATRAVGGALQRILDAPHRRPLAWPSAINGSVSLSGTWLRNGFRPVPVSSESSPVAAGASLTFNAKTTVAHPHRVYWQVVNTGRAAAVARHLRGNFEEGQLIAGNLTRHEAARYRGVHTYRTSDSFGDGQVVVVEFTDNITFEVLPVFENKDGSSWTYPNANNGGSWKVCNPRTEIKAVDARNGMTNKNLKYLCRMARVWRDYWSVPMSGILIDTVAYQFIETYEHRDKSFLYHDFMMRDFLLFLSQQNATQTFWRAPGSASYVWRTGGFERKAKQGYNLAVEAIQYNDEDYEWSRRQKWRELFGPLYPQPR